MNNLLSVRTNILYAKKDKAKKEDPDEYLKYHELVFLVDKAKYVRTNDGEVVRERAIDDFRFVVSEENFNTLIKLLVSLQSADESDLG